MKENEIINEQWFKDLERVLRPYITESETQWAKGLDNDNFLRYMDIKLINARKFNNRTKSNNKGLFDDYLMGM